MPPETLGEKHPPPPARPADTTHETIKNSLCVFLAKCLNNFSEASTGDPAASNRLSKLMEPDLFARSPNMEMFSLKRQE